MATPRKGKAKVKVTASGKKVSYGQAGKAKDGGPRVRAGSRCDAKGNRERMDTCDVIHAHRNAGTMKIAILAGAEIA